MKSKKGDVPVTILVIGVFMIVGLALLSFYFSSLNFKGIFLDVWSVEEANSVIDEYYFYKEVGGNKESIIEVLELKNEGGIYLEFEAKLGEGVSVFYVLED